MKKSLQFFIQKYIYFHSNATIRVFVLLLIDTTTRFGESFINNLELFVIFLFLLLPAIKSMKNEIINIVTRRPK